VFVAGAFLIGFGAGLFGHGTLTSTMNHAPAEQRGLALGTWGAVQATAAGVAVATGGILRDVVSSIPLEGGGLLAAGGATFGYTFVYSLEITLLFATLVAMLPLLRRESSEPAPC
jgi:BCD family chlorophyll transporter-like MFS transporter